jgi:hypothetical protein
LFYGFHSERQDLVWDNAIGILPQPLLNGTEETYRLGDSAAKDSAEGSERSAKVTVYYTEDAGHKVAHFFKRAT